MQNIITYQISGGTILNFAAMCRTPGGEGTPYTGSWVAQVPREELVSQLEGWEPEVQQMLQVRLPRSFAGNHIGMRAIETPDVSSQRTRRDGRCTSWTTCPSQSEAEQR